MVVFLINDVNIFNLCILGFDQNGIIIYTIFNIVLPLEPPESPVLSPLFTCCSTLRPTEDFVKRIRKAN